MKRLLRPLFGTLALGFVVYAAWQMQRRWQTGQSIEIQWGPLLLSCVPLCGAAVVLAWGWKRLLEHMSGCHIPTSGAIALNLESQLARYMPGKVGVPAIRMAGAGLLGLSARTVLTSVFVEVTAFVAVGFVVALSLFSFSGIADIGEVSWFGHGTAIAAAGVSVATVGLVTLDRRRLPARVLAMIGLTGSGTLVPVATVVAHAVYWTCWAVHGYFVALAVGGSEAAAATGAAFFVAAPILGFLALVAPGGVGVREAILAVGLAPGVGPAAALAAAGLSRAVSLVADVVVWLASRPWRLRARS